MKRALEVMAEEISQSLFRQFQSPVRSESLGLSVADLVARRLAEEVVTKLRGDASAEGDNLYQELDARLRSLEARMELLPQLNAPPVNAPPAEQEAGAATSFPNLKYAKPKYKDMESVLKYVEQDQEKGGVKLVIMNFND